MKSKAMFLLGVVSSFLTALLAFHGSLGVSQRLFIVCLSLVVLSVSLRKDGNVFLIWPSLLLQAVAVITKGFFGHLALVAAAILFFVLKQNLRDRSWAFYVMILSAGTIGLSLLPPSEIFFKEILFYGCCWVALSSWPILNKYEEEDSQGFSLVLKTGFLATLAVITGIESFSYGLIGALVLLVVSGQTKQNTSWIWLLSFLLVFSDPTWAFLLGPFLVLCSEKKPSSLMALLLILFHSAITNFGSNEQQMVLFCLAIGLGLRSVNLGQFRSPFDKNGYLTTVFGIGAYAAGIYFFQEKVAERIAEFTPFQLIPAVMILFILTTFLILNQRVKWLSKDLKGIYLWEALLRWKLFQPVSRRAVIEPASLAEDSPSSVFDRESTKNLIWITFAGIFIWGIVWICL